VSTVAMLPALITGGADTPHVHSTLPLSTELAQSSRGILCGLYLAPSHGMQGSEAFCVPLGVDRIWQAWVRLNMPFACIGM